MNTLRRDLGVFSATMLGLGSIIGTGIFVSIGIAVGVAGPAVIIAIAIAAALAVCNALSSAQLAANHPTSGGTYEYGYVYLKPWLGFSAGWMFLCAKSASAATAALGFAGYALVAVGAGESRWHVPLALAGAAALVIIVLSGLRRSNVTNIVIVSITLVSLIFFIVAGAPAALANSADNLRPFFDSPSAGGEAGRPAPIRLLEAAALMFVAYTGYGRIATMGEEVRDPRRTIPRAIIATMIVSMVLYMAVGIVGVAAAGAGLFGQAGTERAAPLAVVARGFDTFGLGGTTAAVILSIGAITAMLGVLLNLILGLSRVALAMGRRGDLPRVFGRLSGDDKDIRQGAEGAQRAAESGSGGVAEQAATSDAPTRANKALPSVPSAPLWFKTRRAKASDRAPAPTAAILLAGAIILGLTAVGSIRLAWSFSAFTVLLYYAITNLAAIRLPRKQRLYHPSIAWLGLAGCLSLAFWVEPRVWAAGLALLAAGLLLRWIVRRGRM